MINYGAIPSTGKERKTTGKTNAIREKASKVFRTKIIPASTPSPQVILSISHSLLSTQKKKKRDESGTH